MANKDHSLDEKIIKASTDEFMEFGFEKASLRKIASNAGVTIGAIYTRYPTKDKLFCSLCQKLIENIASAFDSLKVSYYKAGDIKNHDFAEAIKLENDAVLHLLFDDYQSSKLLLCKSRGSSLESFFDTIVDRKISETLMFFKSLNVPHPDERVLRIVISSQFHMYEQIFDEGYEIGEAKKIMNELMKYHLAGWKCLLGL